MHSVWSKSLVIQRPEVSKLGEMNRFFEILAEIDNIFKCLCVEKVQEILQQTRNPLFYLIFTPPAFVQKRVVNCRPQGGITTHCSKLTWAVSLFWLVEGWPTTTGMVAAVLNKAATLGPDGNLHYSMLLLHPKLHAFKGPRRPVRAARSLMSPYWSPSVSHSPFDWQLSASHSHYAYEDCQISL